MISSSRAFAPAVILALLVFNSGRVEACPFCSAQSQTLSEEISTMDVVVMAKLVRTADPDADEEALGLAEFKVTDVVVGDGHAQLGDIVQTIYFGSAKLGTEFLLFGVDPPKISWSTPTELTATSKKYVHRIVKLPESGSKRLEFFQSHLESEESLLAQDAYDEFARAPYSDIQSLKPKMDRQKLLAWIHDADVPASRRRLYLTMLGICGKQEDLPTLEGMLRSKDRRLKGGLDAMIACYLTLKGAEGLPLVDELFLLDTEVEYSDTYAAIMALRFHGTEGGVIPREKILVSMRHMLKRPTLADLVIPDLARWEDWSQMDRLVELFKNADDKSSWVKVPVINYMRACPLPVAKKKLEVLAKLDPETVERAQAFFPFTDPSDEESEEAEEGSGESKPSAGEEPAKSAKSTTGTAK